MIRRLAISGFALLDSLELSLGPGLNVISGGSGEGKTLVLSALRFGLGEGGSGRAAAERLVRRGAEAARVELELHAPWLTRAPELADLPLRQTTTLVRELSRGGRGRCILNGEPVKLETLRRVGAMVADVFAQGSAARLVSEDGQRELLDACGGLTRRIARYSERREAALALEAQRAALLRLSAELEGDSDLAALRATERDALSELEPCPGEPEELRTQIGELEDRQAERERLDALLYRLQDGDERTLEDELLAASSEVADLGLEAGSEALAAAAAAVVEAADAVRRASERCEVDGAELDELRERLAAHQALARRLGLPVDLLAERWEEVRALPDPAELAARFARLERDLRVAWAELDGLASELGAARRKAARKLTKAVTTQLPALGLGSARVSAEVQDLEGHPSPAGPQRVLLRFQSHPEMTPAPLADASGGERSRLFLLLARHAGDRGLLVFDEVDQNVGARLGAAVGACLATIAQRRQVLAVTHLAPVAARAQRHLRITREGAQSAADLLSADERVEELALMIRGRPLTAAARAQARELLSEARRERKGRKKAEVAA